LGIVIAILVLLVVISVVAIYFGIIKKKKGFIPMPITQTKTQEQQEQQQFIPLQQISVSAQSPRKNQVIWKVPSDAIDD
jgi:preprotein translocase subunit SecY